MKVFLRSKLSPVALGVIKFVWGLIAPVAWGCHSLYGKYIITPIRLRRNITKQNRKLEIGPGAVSIPGFETLNVVWGRNVDYVLDASRTLPFPDGTFDLVYASHILEHIPWYMLKPVLLEWNRIISPNGLLEIWVPNGLLIAKTFVDAEEGLVNNIENDGWYKFNEDKDVCVWANGRIFSYGDGTGKKNDPNWHLTLFSPRFLRKLMQECGFIEIGPDFNFF